MIDALLGTTIDGRYRLIEVVGSGGMGVVYRAADERLSDRPCAVKLLLGTSMDPEEGERFEREVRIIARLRSAHVVGVLDTGITPEGRRYIVMELLEGVSLAGLLKHGGPVEATRAVRIIRGVLAGLAEAHEHGVVHRDLKPANVWVTRARTGEELSKVLDFGIAKDARDGEDLTGASMVIGTPKYMAPEQFRKQPSDNRTDLYAVGLLLYQMLYGEAPFTARNTVPQALHDMPDDFKVGWLHLNQPPAALPVAPDLWAVLARLLAKKPDDRYGSAEEVLDALSPGAAAGPLVPDGTAPGPRSPSGVSSTTGFPVMGESLAGLTHARRPKSNGRLIATIAASIVVTGALAAAWVLTGGDAGDTAAARGAAAICTVVLRSEPPGAVITVGPDVKGATPAEFERPCDEKWMVKLEKKGFKDHSEVVAGQTRKQIIEVTLDPEVARAAPPPAPAPVAPAPLARQPAVEPRAQAPKPRAKVERKVEPKARPKHEAPRDTPAPPPKGSPLYF